MEYRDQLHRIINLPKTPSRIVSLVPSQTELLVDLGLIESIVGITKFCVHPRQLRAQKTIVGGTKTVHFDKIKGLNPEIIICNKEENTLEMVEGLEPIAPVWVSDVNNIEQSLEMIRSFGSLFKVDKKASRLISGINGELDDFRTFIARKTPKKVIYLIWKNPYMAAGQRTFINTMLQLNQFHNIVADKDSRYPEITEEILKEAEVVLLSTEPFPFNNNDVLMMQELLKAEVRLVDGEYFSWYGSRLRKAFGYFKTLHSNY